MSTTPEPSGETRPVQKQPPGVGRRVFRFFRTTLLVLVLIVAVLGFFLNKVGLPEFVKRRVVAQARAKGFEVQFSRLRLRWYRGIVAEDLQINGTNGLGGPQLFLQEGECPLNLSALKDFKLKMNSLQLRGGRLIWPLPETNQPTRSFLLNNLNAQLFFQENDLWELRFLEADFHGIKLVLSGTLTNALRIAQWRIPEPAKKTPFSAETLLRRIENIFKQLKLAGPRELQADFQGDGQDFSTFRARLSLAVPGLDSPWGSVTNLAATAQLNSASETNGQPSVKLQLAAEKPNTRWGKAALGNLELELKPRLANQKGAAGSPQESLLEQADLSISLTGAESRWGQAEYFLLKANSARCATNPALTQVDVSAAARELESDWGQATNAQLIASVWHPLTNWMPGSFATDFHLDAVQTPWGDAEQAHLRAQGSLPPANEFQLFQTNLVWDQRLENILLEASASFSNLLSHDIQIETGSLNLESRLPLVRVEAAGNISGGDFTVMGEMNSTTRALSFSALSRVDPGKLVPLLSSNSQRWLHNYSFESPPKLRAQGRLILPAWSNGPPDWSAEVMPTLALAGDLEMGPGSYRGISFISARSPFSLTNRFWRMPQLRVARPEGALEADYSSNLSTRDFYWRGQSQIDLNVAKPFFPTEKERQVFELFQFTAPPLIQGQIWGSWQDLKSLGLIAQVAATNFTFRGEVVQDCQSHLEYTNQLFRCTDSQVQREHGERGAASEITIDLRAQKIHFINGVSTLNPYVVTRAIGKTAMEAVAPYQFDAPPTVQVHGTLDLKRKRYEEDMHFEVHGKEFHWQQFRLQQLEGKVDWVGQTLGLSNIIGAFRTGGLAGDAHFDFTSHQADFSVKAAVVGADLREIATPFSGRTNKLEGLLSAQFVLTHALAGDPKSWQGHGHLDLRDGLIWDIPMFGLFSPVLNAFLPGLGNSRANQATATVLLTNGIFSSKDMEIRATMMRMECQGAVGLNQRVDARVEAELLRDVPAVGFLISKVFWPVTKLFEYKVTGTLGQPKAEPLYVLPKVLLMPFHPFKTFKEMFLEEQNSPNEKSPPAPIP